ncbi:voltage-dependent P/Q-type calcium channel subunit alpha-1A-like [Dama dama]|uniref:voltage-dependent P/Q-type calcium channel subunit alpha-1A-like n=1 Tax=Dama dama TaxID=30532 RepID=UPI002A36A567|nr:voltage-dependent P/Q-type calcium channel subunit alpha-1A-like [Dama dama]
MKTGEAGRGRQEPGRGASAAGRPAGPGWVSLLPENFKTPLESWCKARLRRGDRSNPQGRRLPFPSGPAPPPARVFASPVLAARSQRPGLHGGRALQLGRKTGLAGGEETRGPLECYWWS